MEAQEQLDPSLLKWLWGESAVKKRTARISFDMIDTDGSGSLTFDELRTSSALGDVGLSEVEIERLIQKYDTNNDGEIQFAEFQRMWQEAVAAKGGTSQESNEGVFVIRDKLRLRAGADLQSKVTGDLDAGSKVHVLEWSADGNRVLHEMLRVANAELEQTREQLHVANQALEATVLTRWHWPRATASASWGGVRAPSEEGPASGKVLVLDGYFILVVSPTWPCNTFVYFVFCVLSLAYFGVRHSSVCHSTPTARRHHSVQSNVPHLQKFATRCYPCRSCSWGYELPRHLTIWVHRTLRTARMSTINISESDRN